jgi:putative hydrolase of the HAD superfamily
MFPSDEFTGKGGFPVAGSTSPVSHLPTTDSRSPESREPKPDGLVLIFDADDTLWENNIHFERAIEEFLDFLDHSTLSREDARAALDEIERANAGAHGYGARAFAAHLRTTWELLAERHVDEASIATVMAFGERILAQPIELIAGVQETLEHLAARHDLHLLTKGQHDEQRRKIEESGIASWFRHAEIVPEKHEDAYRGLVARLGLDPARSWMIGNSPKSDINPALAAGLNAVFVPHPATWRLEHQEIRDPGGPGQLVVIERFTELRLLWE